MTGRDGDEAGGRGPRRRGRATAAGRRAPMLITFLGVLVVVGTQAADRGLVPGVTLGWPVYLVGAVLIAIGILGVGRGEADEDGASDDEAAGEEPSLRRGGLRAGAADRIERLRETARHVEDARRSRPHERER